MHERHATVMRPSRQRHGSVTRSEPGDVG